MSNHLFTAEVILFSAAMFFAIIINLAAKTKVGRSLTGFFAVTAGVCGSLLYGTAFAVAYRGNFPAAVPRTVWNVCRMYMGVPDWASIQAAHLDSIRWIEVVFWIVHLMALYCTASAAIATLGESAMKRLRFWLQRYGATTVIYGINEDSILFGQTLTSAGKRNLIYVGTCANAAFAGTINAMGCLLRTDGSAMNPDLRFLKSIGSEKGAPHLTLYALDYDESRNQVFAGALLKALEEQKVDTSHVSLVLRGNDDSVQSDLQQTVGRYGYGDVKTFTNASVSARMLMQAMPPCRKMEFDENGRAKGDFDAVIIGFGRSGRCVLRQLLQNAQFEGSHFRAGVFSLMPQNETGYFSSSYPGVITRYDVDFCNVNAQSIEFFRYLEEHLGTLRYVISCTGSQMRDNEICAEISSFLHLRGSHAAVCSCSGKSIGWSENPGEPVCYRTIYTSDVLLSDTVDRRAMLLNHSYCGGEITAEDAWKQCSYFDRESSRASADFMEAFIRMSGLSRDEVTEESWKALSPAVMENMARTEHLRWCAFHYAMGFLPMNLEDFRLRGELYRKQLQAGEKPIRIGKDMLARRHACLCAWEELEALSEREAQYTGKRTDYHKLDLDNVAAVPALLRMEKEKV